MGRCLLYISRTLSSVPTEENRHIKAAAYSAAILLVPSRAESPVLLNAAVLRLVIPILGHSRWAPKSPLGVFTAHHYYILLF